MIDIGYVAQGLDLGRYDTQNFKAANILNTQLGALEYLPNFGVDLKYFLSEDFQFQNEAFQSYLIQVLANNGINVSTITSSIEALFVDMDIKLTPPETSGGMIR